MLLGISKLKKLGAVVAINLLIGIFITATHTNAVAAPQKRSEIIEKAKKEKKVLLYTVTNLRILTYLKSAFEKKYPFLELEYLRTGAAKLLARAQTEYRKGRKIIDVFSSSFWGTHWLYEEGLLGIYKSPERAAIEDFAKDKAGYWTSDYINLGVIAYNTKLVPPNKVPKSYYDLLDPWWKGKISLDDTGYWWYGLMLEIFGKEKGHLLMAKLAQQDITIRRGQTLKVQLLSAGEFAAIINAYNAQIELARSDGAPLEWIAPLDQPAIPTPHLIGIAKEPPHPNAAKLYIDFILSKQGQQILADLNKVSARTDVAPNPPRLMQGADGKKMKIFQVDFDLARKINSLQDEFRRLFMSPKS